MAIEIKIPKEVNQYEAKAVGPFTLRQFFCLFLCLPLCIGLFLLVRPLVGTDLAGFVAMIPGGIAYLFGWYKPYGMKFEVYMRSVFINSFLAPRKRPYKTENFYNDILTEIKKEETEAIAQSSAGGPKGAKNRSKKYKRSKLAIK